MREPIKDKDRLQHILDAIDSIFELTKDATTDELCSNKIQFYGIVKCIEIIGEAAYFVTKDFRNKHKETPWEQIIRMRHVLVHDYYRIKANEVKYVIEDNLKPLREQIASYLAETDWDEWEKNTLVFETESSAHKALIQTAIRMKSRGYDIKEICKMTGLSQEEIEEL
ncbi:MAG: DUF86 domain-containing protein [Bacteroidales bacterium]|nr:DUF86 domain-containing protein [Bacteroidales bacterium]